MWIRQVCYQLSTLLVVVLLGGFLGATLVWLAPGRSTDERELDARLSEESIQAIRELRESDKSVVEFYVAYMRAVFTGNLGVSQSLNRPVLELLSERLPVTLFSVGTGLALGWSAALSLALLASVSDRFLPGFLLTVFSAGLLCIPMAGLALICLFLGAPGFYAIALVVFSRVFRYLVDVLQVTRSQSHVLAASARGLGRIRILFWHMAPIVLPQVLALAGTSASLALSAAIPMEVICDSAGIGQLVWQAALGRDLPLLVNLTLLVTLMTHLTNLASDLAIAAWRA